MLTGGYLQTRQEQVPLREHLKKNKSITVQELLGNSDVKTTMIFTHVLNRGPTGVRSPMGGL
jgi:hypothetical protein